MDLFNSDARLNVLPEDGEVYYFGKLVPHTNAKHYFDQLLNKVSWAPDQLMIFGKLITTKRKVAWYGDQPFDYTYSSTTKRALPWTKELQELKEIIEQKTGETFNSCLLNLYHDGQEAMGWHSDAEKELKKNGAIGSLSFGAERKFSFKHKTTKETVSLNLENGSLLLMKGITQTKWSHKLPPTKRVHTPRINLTFRTIITSCTDHNQ